MLKVFLSSGLVHGLAVFLNVSHNSLSKKRWSVVNVTPPAVQYMTKFVHEYELVNPRMMASF